MKSSNDVKSTLTDGKTKRTRSIIVRILAAIVLLVGWFLILFSAAMTLFTFLPRVPYLGLATMFLPSFPVVFLLLTLLGGGLIWFGSKRPTLRRIAVALTVLTAVAIIFINVSMMRAYEAAGADISMLGAAKADLRLLKALILRRELPAGKPDEVVQFGTYDGQPLEVSVFKPATGAVAAPVIVYIHGGGWVSNTKDELSDSQKWFADQGWLVFSVDYTLSTEDRHYWDSVHSQIGCALTWINQHAPEYGGDPGKLTLWGSSAGGNLAINVASMSNSGTLTSTCGGTPPPVDAVVALVPGVDPAGIGRNDYSLIGPAVKSMVAKYTGGSAEEFPDRYRSINSSTYLSPVTPPTLLIAAQNDHLVDAQSIYDYAAQAQKIGVQTKLVSVPFADHVTGAFPDSIGSQGYRQLTFNWLTEHGLAPSKNIP